ncbi:MAG: AarF/ABC1/UbiB kinase family protein [Nitriliruptorales bacterium]|nr:AarF/ABC1/UbiB kinase family protein [Nitriliruptorales bacterium]
MAVMPKRSDGTEEGPPPKARASAPGTPLGSRTQRGANIARLGASTSTGYLTSRVRRLRDGDAADARFHAETAEKMVEMLGTMKGAAMKIGQIASFVDLDLPPEAQETYHAVLATLRDAAPAVHPDQVVDVLTEEFGAAPDEVFAFWDPTPLASASIGQVHRAQLHDGTQVVTKVQYPGIAEAVQHDLANAEMFVPLARMFSPNLQIRPLMEELRERLVDELDYQQEALYQQAFFERYDGHPFIRIPRVFPEWCRPRVLTTEYMDGQSFAEMEASTDAVSKRRYGEIIYRFVFGSLNRFRLFNGDPHPGNYLFPGDGTVVFLDFGSVKLFRSITRTELHRQLDMIIQRDVEGLVRELRESGFLKAGEEADGERLMEMFRLFNQPVLEDADYRYTAEFARDVIRIGTDPKAGYWALLRKLNLPPDYLVLNRIQWGVNSILARLGARANWHRIALELMGVRPPTTLLGEEEQPFINNSPFLA